MSLATASSPLLHLQRHPFTPFTAAPHGSTTAHPRRLCPRGGIAQAPKEEERLGQHVHRQRNGARAQMLVLAARGVSDGMRRCTVAR